MVNTGPYALKKNETEARERLHAFWEGRSLGRPALHITAKHPEFSGTPWEGWAQNPKVMEMTPERQADWAHNYVDSMVWLAEAMPGYTVGIGGHVPLLAVLVGGDYDYQKTVDASGAVSWSPAWVETQDDILERPVPRFDPEHPMVTGLVNVMQAVAERVRGRAVMSPPCWVDPLTTLGNLRTEGALCMDLVERPDQVKAWTDAATTLCLEANEHFYQACLRLGHGECLSWLNVMAEGRMEAIHCDFSIMLSPDMYEEFVVPTLRRQAAYFEYSIYHLDGDENMRFLDLIAAVPGLNALQYTRIAGSEYPGRCLSDYRRVRDTGLGLYVNCDNVEQAVEVTELLGPDGLFVALPMFDSVAEAEEAIERITRAWH